jgi:F-type H+-transporting ATPase subunit epsilon
MSLRLKIIQPTRTVLDTECDHVIIPGIEGDFGVSAEHTPFLTKIRPGALTVFYQDPKKKKDTFAIHDGFVSIENDTIRIVSEVIERESEIDRNRAEKAKKRAEERMISESKEDVDFRRAESSLKRAFARIQAISDN